MTVTLELPELALRSLDATWNYERWEKLPDDGNRYEVIDGVLYMTTAPSNFHQWIVQQFIRYIGMPAMDAGLAFFAFAPIGLLMPGCDPVQPDFLVVRKEQAGIFANRRIRGVPDLVVEVLSPSNPLNDKEIKLHAYARAGLPEYVIVDPTTRTLHHYRLEQSEEYTEAAIYGETDIVTFDCLPGIDLTVGALFEGAPDTTL